MEGPRREKLAILYPTCYWNKAEACLNTSHNLYSMQFGRGRATVETLQSHLPASHVKNTSRLL